MLEGRGSVRLLSLPQQLLLDRVGAALGAAGSDCRLAVLALQALSPVNLAQGWNQASRLIDAAFPRHGLPVSGEVAGGPITLSSLGRRGGRTFSIVKSNSLFS